MKTSIQILITLFLLSAASIHAQEGNSHFIVVVNAHRVLVCTDETPVKNVLVEVLDLQGKVLCSQQFNSANEKWSMDLPTLPEGNYSVRVNGEIAHHFAHKAPSPTLFR